MSKSEPIAEGDILDFGRGEFAKVTELDFPSKGSVSLIYLEENETSYRNKSDLKNVKIIKSIGAAVTFDMVRSIHLRLNSLNKI